jgi:hypothetical protein
MGAISPSVLAAAAATAAAAVQQPSLIGFNGRPKLYPRADQTTSTVQHNTLEAQK